jgi:hypothetical protein
MRKQVFPLLFSAILVLASSCNEPEAPEKGKPFDPGDPTNIVVNVTALEHATRTEVDESLIKTQWSESDKIGIYVLFNNELVDVAGLYQIKPESISDDKTSADFHGAWKWHAAALPHRFYAYAPKTDEIGRAHV